MKDKSKDVVKTGVVAVTWLTCAFACRESFKRLYAKLLNKRP